MCDQLNFSGADGLVKLWTVKTNECVATYDHHEDKVPVDPLLYYLCADNVSIQCLTSFFCF